VAEVRQGNDAAFEELYSRYCHRIGAYVRGMVADHGRSEDITQEIFIAALRRMRETERPIAFKPWIYEIAKNACIDSFRRTRRAHEVSLDADDSLSPADRGRLTAITTPDAALDSKQALEDLRGAFGGLSDSHHEILVLRELEGRSYRDIGERLGMSRPVVESTLFRARRRLAEEYDELASGRRCTLVRRMVDSGPHYSLGIRDRRRMTRHFAHCHACRAHARAAGFDESILNIPTVAARIAALLPIPLLRARWGAVEHVGAHRGRPSLLAWRSVQTIASSSDQIVVVGPSAGRGAATAAVLVLAGVGGGVVTVSSQPAAPQRSTIPALAHTAGYPFPGGNALRRAAGSGTSSSSGPRSSGSTDAAGAQPRPGSGLAVGSGGAGTSSGPRLPLQPGTLDSPAAGGPARSTSPGGSPSGAGGGDQGSGANGGAGGTGDPTGAGTGGGAGPGDGGTGGGAGGGGTSGGGGTATTTPSVGGSSPVGPVTGTVTGTTTGTVNTTVGTVDTTLGTVTPAVPQLAPTVGSVAGTHSNSGPVTGTIFGLANGLTAQRTNSGNGAAAAG
jgi:RNA polymerase sigma factor (sigma-70 family)